MNLFDYKHFYDTTDEAADILVKSENKAKKQEREILGAWPVGQYMSQFSMRRAYEAMYKKPLLVASCSRAFTNLTNLGKIEKCDGKEGRELVQVPGEFGKNVYCWKKLQGE